MPCLARLRFYQTQCGLKRRLYCSKRIQGYPTLIYASRPLRVYIPRCEHRVYPPQNSLPNVTSLIQLSECICQKVKSPDRRFPKVLPQSASRFPLCRPDCGIPGQAPECSLPNAAYRMYPLQCSRPGVHSRLWLSECSLPGVAFRM